MPKPPYFAEVVESSLQLWTAQSWQWDELPNFAALMAVEEQNRTVFGIVAQSATTSWHGDRTPFAYQKTEAELMREQPQIFELLRSTFTCLTAGYQAMGEPITHCYAPRPPKIHSFVRPANDTEIIEFFSNDRSIPMLFAAAHHVNLEELLLGLVQFRIQKGLFEPRHYTQFIDTLSLLSGNDYRRLKIFLHRLQPLIDYEQQKDSTSFSVL